MLPHTLNKNGRFPSFAPENLFATAFPMRNGWDFRCEDSVGFDGEGKREGEVG